MRCTTAQCFASNMHMQQHHGVVIQSKNSMERLAQQTLAGRQPRTLPTSLIQTHTHHPSRTLLRVNTTPPHRRQHNAHRIVAASTAIVPTKPSFTLFPAASSTLKAQTAVLDAIKDVKGRGKSGMTGEQQAAFDAAVAKLEAAGGVPRPTASPLLQGRWRLLFTTRPGTASPIQRSFTGVEQFTVYQEIDFTGEVGRINNIVDFGATFGYLKVEAEGSTDTKPLPGFTPRQGAGLAFGLLGISSVTPPAGPDLRIDFQFDTAAFYFKSLPFTIPYPVPFRLLGDETKGWLDITYMSPDGQFRLSRGNKGTLFVLVKDEPPREAMLSAIAGRARDADIEALVEEAAAQRGGVKNPAASPVAVGRWRLRWTKQDASANPLQRALAGKVRNWQIITEDGRLENRVQLAPGVTVRALASCGADAPARTGVTIEKVVVEVGPLRFNIPFTAAPRGFVDWLYLDDGLRITRGSKGSLFVHTRDEM